MYEIISEVLLIAKANFALTYIDNFLAPVWPLSEPAVILADNIK